MKPTFDNLLKWSTVLLFLPVTWAWLQPERSSPWLFRACQVLFLIISLVRLVYRYREPTFDNLLKCLTVLLVLPLIWCCFGPERFSPWLFAACFLSLASCLLLLVYRNRTNKGPGPNGAAQVRPEEG